MTHRLLILALASLFATPVLAGDPAAGAEIAKKVCAACHGADGNSSISPEFPKLAGQHEDYLLQALSQYKSGARKNPIMAAQVQPLSEADMRNLAAYFATQDGSLYLIKETRLLRAAK
ncbi:MAG TPA: cytochrome c [Burkholderiales bacterium]|nr:cytochrome c [Burkholderiales bacterium]